jgi:hypothetical protein
MTTLALYKGNLLSIDGLSQKDMFNIQLSTKGSRSLLQHPDCGHDVKINTGSPNTKPHFAHYSDIECENKDKSQNEARKEGAPIRRSSPPQDYVPDRYSHDSSTQIPLDKIDLSYLDKIDVTQFNYNNNDNKSYGCPICSNSGPLKPETFIARNIGFINVYSIEIYMGLLKSGVLYEAHNKLHNRVLVYLDTVEDKKEV